MAAQTKLFTVGYAGRSLPEFVRLLQEHDVKLLVDVRALPLSRRRGFSKTPLREALAEVKISYLHLREAGNPYRQEADDIERCLRLYRNYLDSHPAVVEAVQAAICGQRAALMCLEAEAHLCHRSVIAQQLAAGGVGPALDL